MTGSGYKDELRIKQEGMLFSTERRRKQQEKTTESNKALSYEGGY